MASEKNTTENEKTNKFANDGSFMEMFRKKMEEEQRRKRGEKSTEPQKTSTDTTRGCIDTRVSQSAVRKPELSNQQPQGIHSTSKCSSSVSEDRVQTDNGGGGLHSSAFSSTLVGKKPGTMSFVRVALRLEFESLSGVQCNQHSGAIVTVTETLVFS